MAASALGCPGELSGLCNVCIDDAGIGGILPQHRSQSFPEDESICVTVFLVCVTGFEPERLRVMGIETEGTLDGELCLASQGSRWQRCQGICVIGPGIRSHRIALDDLQIGVPGTGVVPIAS